jgi:hypothetical protein
MKTRYNQTPPQKTIKSPGTTAEWNRLMRTVIGRAEQLRHKSLPGLREALAQGRAEQHLRRMGIIHQGDIEREFPQT